MARQASMTVEEAESAIGARGFVGITTGAGGNRDLVRKWLVAKGFSSGFACGLSKIELGLAYNDTSDEKLETLRRKQNDGLEALGGEDDDKQEAPATNGHATPQWSDPANAIENAIRIIAESVTPRSQTIDAESVRKIVREEISGVAPRVIEIRQQGKESVKIDGVVHACFERVLKILSACPEQGILLVGPAGCGKTHIAEQIAKALGASFGAIHGSAGASESALTGWLLPGDGGRFEYCPSVFVKLYGDGESLFLFDELDAFDANMLLVANGAMANGHLHIAHNRDNPCVERGKNARIVATANTFGTGANPMYCGRSPLDAATLDRFVVITVDYDKRIEEKIGAAGGLSAKQMADIWALRNKVRESNLRRTISTRAFQKAGAMLAAGDDWNTVMATLVEGWTRDEKSKVGM